MPPIDLTMRFVLFQAAVVDESRMKQGDCCPHHNSGHTQAEAKSTVVRILSTSTDSHPTICQIPHTIKAKTVPLVWGLGYTLGTAPTLYQSVFGGLIKDYV